MIPFFLLVETTNAGLLIKSCWLFGAFVAAADVGRLRQATFWMEFWLLMAFWVWERERFPCQAHWAENWGCWILSLSAPTSVEQARLRSETRDPSLSKPFHSSAIQGENFFVLVNFAVLARAPGRLKNFVHVASKQVFRRGINLYCSCCKSAINLPAASTFPLMMKSWTDQNCESCETWLLMVQPGESGADHRAGGRKQKYSRRTERELRHSRLLHLLTLRRLHWVCEHCESSSSCCCCSCPADLGPTATLMETSWSSCSCSCSSSAASNDLTTCDRS